MKKILVTYILFMFFFTTCKKKDTVCEVAEETNTLVNTSLENGFGKNVNNLHGVFWVGKSKYYFQSNITYGCFASFNPNSQPWYWYYRTPSFVSQTGVNTGTLQLNGTTLKYELSRSGSINTYGDSTGAINYTNTINWNLTANACCLSSSNVTITKGFPLTNATINFPSTISKSADFTISFGSSNQLNTDSIIVYLIGGDYTTEFPNKHISANTSSITFGASELINVGAGAGRIFVYGLNYANNTVNSKNYLYIMQSSMLYDLTINP